MKSDLEERFDGTPSAWWVIAWMAGGLLLGAGVGALIGDVTYKPDPSSLLDFGREFNVIFGAVLGAPIGLLLGALSFVIWRVATTRARAADLSGARSQ